MSLPSPSARNVSQSAHAQKECPFCDIATAHPSPGKDLSPPSPASAAPSRTYLIVSTSDVLAFLDIYPLVPCHVLVCSRRHAERVSDLSPTENAVVAAWLPVVARAALKVTGYQDFNIVQNNGANAAQVVPHVHYHIIPRPDERQREQLQKRMQTEDRRYWRSPFGGGLRYELDDDDGKRLAEALKAEVFKEVGTIEEGGKDKQILANL